MTPSQDKPASTARRTFEIEVDAALYATTLQDLESLRTSSRLSVVMVSIGATFLACSVLYSAIQLAPLEKDIAKRQMEIAVLRQSARVEEERVRIAKREYADLKRSVEDLYSVRVTPHNRVYEVRAAAKATGHRSGSDLEYRFTIRLNAPPAALKDFEQVEYVFDHPSFKTKAVFEKNAENFFEYAYVGVGCLTNVGVVITLKDGTTQIADFDMCRSLGSEWD